MGKTDQFGDHCPVSTVCSAPNRTGNAWDDFCCPSRPGASSSCGRRRLESFETNMSFASDQPDVGRYPFFSYYWIVWTWVVCRLAWLFDCVGKSGSNAVPFSETALPVVLAPSGRRDDRHFRHHRATGPSYWVRMVTRASVAGRHVEDGFVRTRSCPWRAWKATVAWCAIPLQGVWTGGAKGPWPPGF